MLISRALQRLLRILDLEEEQRRMALDSARGELAGMERSRNAAVERQRAGRRLITAGMQRAELEDTLGGIAENEAGARHQAALDRRIAAQTINVSALREAFLSKRIERQQTETLIREAETEQRRLAERRGQQSLDDGYLNRMREEER